MTPMARTFVAKGNTNGDIWDAANFLDDEGRPAGGTFVATGTIIRFQNGPLGRGEDRRPPNGTFIETLLECVAERLRFYQATQFSCRENALALTKVEEAIHWLNSRTERREAQNVEGTHEGS